MNKEQNRLKMKDLPLGERPYEKLEAYGAETLSNAELLAVIIRTGNRSETSVALAQRLLSGDREGSGLCCLNNITLEGLKEIDGIGRVKAIQLKALAELSKRMASTSRMGKRVTVKSPDDVCTLLMEEMRHLKKEVFKIVLLNTKNHVIKHVDISVGSVNASIVHPREVFSEAVKTRCTAMVLVHNHPSGDPEPSTDDVGTTKRLTEAGNILGIKVLDHIIIGDRKYFSFKEKGLI